MQWAKYFAYNKNTPSGAVLSTARHAVGEALYILQEYDFRNHLTLNLAAIKKDVTLRLGVII
jgi:microcystin degradation protein MlrC